MDINPEALKALRERTGISATALAAAVGIGKSHMSNIEAGRRTPSPAVAKAIAAELRVPVSAILATPTEATP